MQQQKKPAGNHEANHRDHTSHDVDNSMNYNFPAVSDTKNSEPNSTPDSTETSAEANISQDFDLRRAIIYSEILKPKFDEE